MIEKPEALKGKILGLKHRKDYIKSRRKVCGDFPEFHLEIKRFKSPYVYLGICKVVHKSRMRHMLIKDQKDS